MFKKTKIAFCVVMLLSLFNVCAMAASNTTTVTNWNSDYTKTAALKASSSVTGTMTAKFKFGNAALVDKTSTTTVGVGTTDVIAETKWTGKKGGSKSAKEVDVLTVEAKTSGILWEGTSTTYHKSTIVKNSVTDYHVVKGTR